MNYVESATAERWWGAVRVPRDPSGVLPEFAVTTAARTDPPSDGAEWHEGRWATAWDSKTGRIEAESALLGAGEVLDVEAGTVIDLWIRWGPVDGETPVMVFDRIEVR